MIERHLAPDHLFEIAELDFSGDLFAAPLNDPWFRLGLWSSGRQRVADRVEEIFERQSLLLPSGSFPTLYDRLGPIGNTLSNMGEPTLSVLHDGATEECRYNPFHNFSLPFTSISAEPLVFFHARTSGSDLFVNPDLSLYLGLEERPPNSRAWWDPRRAQEALRRMTLGDDVVAIEIRTEYLLRYLQARQMALLVGHYHHRHLFNATPEERERYVAEDLTLGSAELGVKAIFNNWGLRDDILRRDPFLQRRLHLWFQIEPQHLDITNLWSDAPTFDIYAFTFPMQDGLVAPARFRHQSADAEHDFAGVACDFMDRIFFRQEVLAKYETTSGFAVDDNGSVRCEHYWSLSRSTFRLGNGLLSTAIGDFAEGVPFEEWPHWQRYSVEPPSETMLESVRAERPIPEAVNRVVEQLDRLSGAFTGFSRRLGVHGTETLWRGSLDSLAGRQLKWVYPDAASSDEFLKRATLLSTLVIDELQARALRRMFSAVDANLHLNDDTPPRPLASRNLLQRATLTAALIEDLDPDRAALSDLVKQAEGKQTGPDADLQRELDALNRRIREEFAPWAFLYGLRLHAGLAHSPNRERFGEAAAGLGLPRDHWHRRDYLRLLELVAAGIERAAAHFRRARLE
jgi:hypothetical protein